MSTDMREYIAYLDVFVKYFCTDEKTAAYFQKNIRPSLKRIGFALWKRDTVTDMALRKGSGTEEESFDVDSRTKDSAKDELDSK